MKKIAALILLLSAVTWAAWTRSPTVVNPLVGTYNEHYMSSNHRVAWFPGYLYSLESYSTTSGSDRTYRSLDSGATWAAVDSFSRYSGCLVSGANGRVWHAWMNVDGDSVLGRSWQSDKATPLNLVTHEIDYNTAISNSGKGNEYRVTSCAVDSGNVFYVAVSWAPATATTLDRVQVYRILDTAFATVQGPFHVAALDSTARWVYPMIEVDATNRPILTASMDGGIRSAMFCRSPDTGVSWGCNLIFNAISGNGYDNLQPISISPSQVGVIGQYSQGSDSTNNGVQFVFSSDTGVTWTSPADGDSGKVDSTCGYGDPALSIDTAGVLYAAYRSSTNTGITTGTCGDKSRFKLSRSADMGVTWTAVDSCYPSNQPSICTERMETRAAISNQTWHQGSSPLMWQFVQRNAGATSKPTYFNINDSIIVRTYVPNEPPTITANPSNATVSDPATANFSCTATGSETIVWAWRKNGSVIGGATLSSYTTPATSSADNGATFDCIATNDFGADTSTAATLTVLYEPVVSVNPQNRSVVVPATATFSCAGTGNPSPTVKWQADGVDIGGATSTSYTTPSTTLADNGQVFRCVFTNSEGSTNSSGATLTVSVPSVVRPLRAGLRVNMGLGF